MQIERDYGALKEQRDPSLLPRRAGLRSSWMTGPSGRHFSGLAGPLRIRAASVDVSATRLSSPSLQAVITSGHLAATFTAPPKQVSVTLTSAQATLSLPGSVGYAVSDQVTSGYVHVGIPVTAGTAHTVTARVLSGELDLLAS